MKSTKTEKTALIEARLKAALTDPVTILRTLADFQQTFEYVGLPPHLSRALAEQVILALSGPRPLHIKEEAAHLLLQKTMIGQQDLTILNMCEAVDLAIVDRSDLIYRQISRYLLGFTGPIIDFGCGNGKVAQFLKERDAHNVFGYDVVSYQTPGITIPVHVFNGISVPVEDDFFEAAVVTNVIHHEANNENILKELTRIVRRRLVIIETVPIGDTPEEVQCDRHRTFMNDFLYNRVFCYGADIPTPGTYETPTGWINRFEKYGWKTVASVDLGIDQKVIQDTHHLLVFDK